jgi:UDP-2,4-diacetamido-2,4,6-trideoxy-beta-L-altropyranose hydrolase
MLYIGGHDTMSEAGKYADNLYIRTDMNAEIATGHVMRCLSIADAASALGLSPVFILADDNAVELVSGKGYEAIVLGTAWNHMDEELPSLLDVIEKRDIKSILIDSYMVTYDYMKRLSEVVRVSYIDDIDAFEYPVERIICYANYYSKFSYAKKNNQNKLLLGCKYAPLRQEFKNLPAKSISDNVNRILLLIGGTDPYHALKRMLDALAGAGYTIDVICGRYNADYDYMAGKYQNDEKVNIIRHTDKLIDYMKAADVAISAGGSTLYELCAVGTPTISYAFADNQLDNVRQFQNDGLMPYAGDVRHDDFVRNILEYMDVMVQTDYRSGISAKMQSLVDGNGAERIAKELGGLNG